jgi:hypothetical protein
MSVTDVMMKPCLANRLLDMCPPGHVRSLIAGTIFFMQGQTPWSGKSPKADWRNLTKTNILMAYASLL